MAKVMAVSDAIKTYIKDGATITFGGVIGSAHPEEVSLTIEQEFLENGSPNNLTLLYAAGMGDSKEKGLNHLGHEAMRKSRLQRLQFPSPLIEEVFTFQQSIKEHALKFPKDEFDPKDFVSEPLENEHFDVEVSKELFDIAKKKNPFYLEDEDSLRYIDDNDTLTLNCNGKSLTFLVKEIDRSIKTG